MGWDPNFAALYPVSVMPLWLCVVTGYGLGLVLPGLLVLGAAQRWMTWKRAVGTARRTAAEARERKDLEAGKHVLGEQVLHGTVASVDGGGDTAIRVEIEQVGSERKSKSNYTSVWHEVRRDFSALPFELALEGRDERIRVEPNDEARLVENLEELERTGYDTRLQRALLTVGEAVYVRGHLAHGIAQGEGYRDHKNLLVLKPPKSGRMLLSARPLEEPLSRRVRLHRNFFWLILLVSLGLLYLLHKPYFITTIYGKTGVCELVAKRHFKRKSGKKYRWVHLITVKILETGGTFREELERADYFRLKKGDKLPVVFHKDWLRYSQIGQHPAAPYPVLLTSLVVLVGLIVFYLWAFRRSRAWYERSSYNESEDGRLESSYQQAGGRSVDGGTAD